MVLLIVGIALYPSISEAKYDPAPRHVVKAGLSKKAPRKGTTERRAWIICRIFGKRRCVAILNVAHCESSLRPWARNGQYLGMFQMGSSERARFGHDTRNVWTQARAARRYFLISSFGPWECKPWPEH